MKTKKRFQEALTRARRTLRRAWRTMSGARRRALAERVRSTVVCRDTDVIPKVADAGQVVTASGVACQVMHNGVKVVAGGFFGDAMTEIIRELKGHHEPQQERVFHEVLKHVRDDAVMIEVGAFWGYYSLWFRHGHPRRRCFLIEPVPWKRAVGQRNFALNGFDADFTGALVGGASGERLLRVRGEEHRCRVVSLPEFFAEKKLDFVDVLHADVQGGELAMLTGAAELLDAGRIGYFLLSTHRAKDSITRADTHRDCIDLLTRHGYEIVVEHSVAESFSEDGLVCARGPRAPSLPPIEITRRRS